MGMATYKITPHSDQVGFDVAVMTDGGLVQTTLGFASEAAAKAWVKQATRLTKSLAPRDKFGRPKV
jgi:hypothetical protein